MGKSAFRKSVFIYDFLLKLYPKSYRHEFGEEMRYVFSELLKETNKEKGEQGIITLWSRTILDVGKTAITQHIENQKGGDLMNSKNSKNLPHKNTSKRLGIWALVVLGILMIPLVGRFPWTTGDFVFAGAVLFACATIYEVSTRKMKNKWHRIAVGAGVLAFIVLVLGWAATGPDGAR